MDQETLLIRVDANPRIGTGHIMRCLALGEAWQDCGGRVIVVQATASPLLEKRLTLEKMDVLHINSELGSVNDADETVRIAYEKKASWIVVDGYHFGAEYQKIIKDSGFFLLFIDDYGQSDHYYADIVVNQNIYAEMSLYKKFEPYTRFLLGTKYVLLRKEFLAWTEHKRDIPDVARKVLITFGGSDTNKITLKVIEALKKIEIDGLEVIAVVGGSNPNYKTIRRSVKECPGFSVRKNVNNMPELMAWADVAISAGGSTCWELAFMGLPSILCPVAENQKLIAKGLYNINAAQGFTDCILPSTKEISVFINSVLKMEELRSEQSRTQKKIVDGAGAKRVVSIMMEKIEMIGYEDSILCE